MTTVYVPPRGSLADGKFGAVRDMVGAMRVGDHVDYPFSSRESIYGAARSHNYKVKGRQIGDGKKMRFWRVA